MGYESLARIREYVKRDGVVPVTLDLRYRAVFSTLQGNLPVNDRIWGMIVDVPLDLRLEYTVVPNIVCSFPVNHRLTGTIGDTPVQARMTWKLIFNTLAGNIPVNTGIEWHAGGKRYRLNIPYTFRPATARGGGESGGGGGGGKKKVFEPKYVRGRMVEVDNSKGGGGNSISFENGRPIPCGLRGQIEDVAIDLRFMDVYYTNTSSGRNPINRRATGFLRDTARIA